MILDAKELFIELYAFGGVCILLILQKLVRNREFYVNKSLFVKLLATCSAVIISDVAWIFFEGNSKAITINYFANICYFIAVSTVCLYWFVFAEQIQGSDWSKKKGWRMVLLVPYFAIVLICISLFKTHWIFYIDDAGYYQRGPLYALHMLCSYGYVFYSVALAIVYAKRDFVERRKHLDIATFIIWPVIGSSLQALTNRPFFAICVVIGILNLYLNLQQQQISTDPLTNSNNKNRLVQYLAEKIKNYDEEETVFLLFLDIDGLRYINDIFGFSKGDYAIVAVVEALRKIASRKGYFVCRYGGDELALVCTSREKIDMKLLISSIQEEVNQALSAEQFDVTLHTGYAQLLRGMSVQKFIYKAYENMRDNKESK